MFVGVVSPRGAVLWRLCGVWRVAVALAVVPEAVVVAVAAVGGSCAVHGHSRQVWCSPLWHGVPRSHGAFGGMLLQGSRTAFVGWTFSPVTL